MLKEALQWRHAPNATFAPDGHHFLLPAFFHTLAELEKQGTDGQKKGKTTQLILVHELSEVSVDFYGEETGTIDVVAKV